MHEKLLIIDLGSTENQSVAKEARELNIYSIVKSYKIKEAELKEINPKAIIVIGDKEVKELPSFLKELNIPFLGVNNGVKALENLGIKQTNASIKDFLLEEAKFKRDWTTSDFIKEAVAEIKAKVGAKKVLCALSGGVDSSVCAALVNKAVSKQLTCVFVDHGLMRYKEDEQITEIFTGKDFNINFIKVNARERFYQKLKGITDPEQKRKIIGEEFIRVFEEEAKKIGAVDFLVQGTIYPDIMESGDEENEVIKSHHNVGGLPDVIDFKEIIEPVKLLFKNEVRNVGRELGLPEYLCRRQPFPGPGLGVRILGEITAEKADILRLVDHIYREEIEKSGIDAKLNQYFAALTNIKAVGVKNGKRTYAYAVCLRAITTIDFMSADIYHLPAELIETVTRRIIEEVPEVNRVLYDFTPKPPATIEFE